MPPETVSTIRPTSALGTVVSLGTLGMFCVIGALVSPRAEIGIIGGALVFLAYRLAAREWLCGDHRRGMRLTQSGNFRDGLAAFRDSEKFWAAHPTLDHLRWALLASAGPYSFLTLARYNQAYCLSRMNRVREVAPEMRPAIELRESLQKVLEPGEPGAERTWADNDPAESTWVFDEPKK